MIQFTGVDVILEDDLGDAAVRRAVAAFLGRDAARLISIHLAPVALPDRTGQEWMQRLCELDDDRYVVARLR